LSNGLANIIDPPNHTNQHEIFLVSFRVMRVDRFSALLSVADAKWLRRNGKKLKLGHYQI
jgi:hypothetical protein